MWRYAGAIRKDFLPQEQKQIIAGIGCKLWENGRLSVGSKFVTYYARKSRASPWKALPGIEAEVCESKNAFFIRPLATRLEHCNPALIAAAHYLKSSPYNLNVISFNTEVPLGNIAGTFQPHFAGMELMQEVAEGLNSTEFCKIGFGIGVPGQWRAPLQMMAKTPPVDQLKLLRLLNPFQDEEEEEMNRMFRVLSNTLDTFLLGRKQLSAIEPRPEELDRLTRWQTTFQKKIATEQMVGDAESVDEGDQQQNYFTEGSLENSLGDDPESPIATAMRRNAFRESGSENNKKMSANLEDESMVEEDPEGDADAAVYRWEVENSRREDYARARLNYIRKRLGVKVSDSLLEAERNNLRRTTTSGTTPTTKEEEGRKIKEFLLKPVSDQALENLLRGGTGKEKKTKKSK